MEFIPTGDVVASLRAAKDMALLAVSITTRAGYRIGHLTPSNRSQRCQQHYYDGHF